MNIGIFTDCYYPQINGVVSSILILREALIKRGHHVTIITVKVPGHVETSTDIIRINSIPFRKWKEFRLGVPYPIQNYRQIKALKLDLIHTHTEFSVGLLGKYIARLLNIPTIHTYHTMYEDYSHYLPGSKHGNYFVKKFMIYGSKSYVKRFNAIIAPSSKTKSALERYGVKNDIYIVPTGVNLEQFQHHSFDDPKICELKQQLDLAPDDKIILSLGRVSEEKSVDLIIDQMKALLHKIPMAKLLIVGDGPYKNNLMLRVKTLGLEKHIIFTGRVSWNDVALYYSMADVFVSASKTETQGLTIMEAMASGVPVVVYDDENIKGVVIDHYSGRLFETKEGLTQCLMNILGDPFEAEKLTQNGYQMIQALSTEKFGENAEKVYEHLLESHTSLQGAV